MAEPPGYNDLLRRAIGGDRSAMATVLEAHQAALLKYIHRHLPPELCGVMEPGDVLQDVYYDACRQFPGFQDVGENALYRWLLTIARRRMIDHLRRQRARPQNRILAGDESAVAHLLEELVTYRRTPSRSARSHEFMAALERAIERLPESYRQAITLRYIDRLDSAGIAVRMNRTPQAVYLLCCRGLKAIREDLQSASMYV